MLLLKDKNKKKELKPAGIEFFMQNSKIFDKSAWSKVNPQTCYEMRESLKKENFKDVPSMMECFFQNCQWKYQSLILKYASLL